MSVETVPRPTAETLPVRQTLTVEETATILGLAPVTVYRMAARGDLSSIKLGARRLILRSAIDGMLAHTTGEGGTVDGRR